MQAAASECEIFAPACKCVCWCILVYLCHSGPLFCPRHTGLLFMTDCNSEGCVARHTSFRTFLQCFVALVGAPGVCTDAAEGCLFHLCWCILVV